MWILIRWRIVVDFLVLAAAFYGLLRWAISARALRIALSVVVLHALALLAQRLDLVVTGWVLDGSAILAILLLLLIFQPELRRAFMQLDSAVQRRWRPPSSVAQQNRIIADTAFDLARDRTGALIVLVRRDAVNELTEGGVTIASAISSPLLIALFQKTSPLHDGAVLVEGGRLAKAGVILPLTNRRDVPACYGTRHRAGMGLTERCDASVVVVSEERGEVTLMQGPKLQPLESPSKLVAALEETSGNYKKSGAGRLRRLLFTGVRLKLAALGLAGLIWSMSFLASGTTIRTVVAPVEFSNVPAGMEISEQSADSLALQIRGSPWIIDSVNLGKLIAHYDLRDLRAGRHTLELAPNALDLPPGVVVDRMIPAKMRIVLVDSQAHAPAR